jgi:hypothetical protein
VKLSLGGEARSVFEGFSNPAFGAAPVGSDESLLQRYMVHTDLSAAKQFRLFSDLKFNLEDGRNGGPRPTDEDTADLHQLFTDVMGDFGDGSAMFRVGRQELWLGSQRLVSIRNGPNVRQAFDGVRVSSRYARSSVDLLYVRPVETDRGAFDDSADNSRSLWGAYATTVPEFVPGSLDLYYLGFSNDEARVDTVSGSELRHTFGVRSFGTQGSWDWNWELFGQGGRVSEDDIYAWSLGTDTGYRLGDRGSPRVGLRANVISGDTDPEDGKLGTFNPLFPRGGYFGEIGVLGPSNLINFHPTIDWPISEQVTASVDCSVFWRYSDSDGVYNPGGALVRSGADSSARFIGTQPSVVLTYNPTKQLFFVATYTHFYPGSFIDQTGTSSVIRFVRLEGGLRF